MHIAAPRRPADQGDPVAAGAVSLPAPPAGLTGWPWQIAAADRLPDRLPDGTRWPRISVVMPSFNQCDFLEAALRSLLLQGYPALELIVIDGGSTDGTRDLLERYAPWLSRWVSEPDAGPAHALNKGFQCATGEILGFLNADDFHLPGALVTLAREFHARPGADVISGHGYFAWTSGALGAPMFSDRWHPQRFAYGACVLVQQATFFRRTAFERVTGFNEHTRTAWDQELWADLAHAGARFERTDAFLGAFRLHRGSITGGTELRAQRRLDARVVLEKARGHRERLADRAWGLGHRLWKFAGHPHRTIRQRLFVYRALHRWSL